MRITKFSFLLCWLGEYKLPFNKEFTDIFSLVKAVVTCEKEDADIIRNNEMKIFLMGLLDV
jgi:hypothetical protein